MSVMTSRGLPPLGSLDEPQPFIDDFVVIDSHEHAINEGQFVRRAIAENVDTLQKARDLIVAMQSEDGDSSTYPTVAEREQRYERTIEEMAVSLSLETAGTAGAVFFLDDGRSYGMIKTADRRLAVFIPPSALCSVGVFDMADTTSLPFLPTDSCNYAVYTRVQPPPTAGSSEDKGKEELTPWKEDSSVVAAAPVVTTAPVVAAASLVAAAPLVAQKPAATVVQKPAAAATVVQKPAAAAKKVASALVPSDDDDEDEEEKPTPTKKRVAEDKDSEEKDKRAKPKKAAAAPTTAKKPLAAAATTEHKK